MTSDGVPVSPARVDAPVRGIVRVAAVQTAWHGDHDTQCDVVREAVAVAADAGASLVCLPELTLSPYFAIDPDPHPLTSPVRAEVLEDGPTVSLLRDLARTHGVTVSGSLYEAVDDAGPGFNTAVCVTGDGSLVAATRKLHLPVTSGYFEDRWFAHGDTGHPVHDLLLARCDAAASADVRVGFPTCWDQWFPETARAYALGGAEALVYPTAIGSEPDHPAFDTQPIWRQVIVAHGIVNGLHVIVPNRTGRETSRDGATTITFYGSSFVSDPYGRVLVQAPRDTEAVVVADVDLDARRDWLALFPLLATRRPDTYGPLTRPVENRDDGPR